MITNNSGNINPILPQKVAEAKQKSINIKPVNTVPASVPDRVEISKQAAEISRAATALNQLPEVRTAAVETAIQKIEKDEKIPSYMIAARMLMGD